MSESPGIGTFAAAVFVPPLAVYLRDGAGRYFWIACGLTLLAWLPGIGFALWTLLRSRGEAVTSTGASAEPSAPAKAGA